MQGLIIHWLGDGLLSEWVREGDQLGYDGSREAFDFHRTHADRSIHIGPPLTSALNGLWTLNVSRRFDQPDGAFAGIALAAIDLDGFAAFYASFDIGAHGAVMLAGDDGA